MLVARITWVSPIALFWIVTIAAGLCVVTSAWVLMVAHRDDRAEVGFLGSSLLVVSVLPLVDGITAPVDGANTSVVAAVYVSLPLARLTALPLLADGTVIVAHQPTLAMVVGRERRHRDRDRRRIARPLR